MNATMAEHSITDAQIEQLADEADAQEEALTHCECGDVYGVPCEWSGDEADTVVVEVMPECFRASHEAAGNSGAYPHNGALRIRVERSCADRLVETEAGWAVIL